MNLQLFGGRGGSSGFSGGISEFYKNRLSDIKAQINHKEILASLIDSNSAVVRKKAAAAQRSVERLKKQYSQIEAAAKREARRGGSF